MVPWCGFCLFFNHVVVPKSYCVFLCLIFVCTNLLLGDKLASKSWESEMCAFYRRDNYLHINCSSLKIYLKNYPSPTCSPSHWAEISLHFLGFKNKVSLSPFLICCCTGRIFLLSFADKAHFWRIQDSWNISAGVVWNSACCEHWLTTWSSEAPHWVSVQVNRIPLPPGMLQAGSSAGTKRHGLFYLKEAVLIYIYFKNLVFKDNLHSSPTLGKQLHLNVALTVLIFY